MPSYRITLAYDGTDFEGWQSQRTAGRARPRTVQGVVEEALAGLAGGTRVPVMAAGRTDAGVHALGQVATFDLSRDMPPDALARALNGRLPGDVRVRGCAAVPAGFDARRDALAKLYRYELDCGPLRWPHRRRVAGYERGPLDHAAVAAAAALFPGTRDFAALASSGSSVKTTVRTVMRAAARFEAEPTTGEERLVFEVVADGFLRKMVRSMVGGLIAAGTGQAAPDALAAALESRDRGRWPPPAEACGLYLVRVQYAGDPALALESTF